jgi:hypothetical protein
MPVQLQTSSKTSEHNSSSIKIAAYAGFGNGETQNSQDKWISGSYEAMIKGQSAVR